MGPRETILELYVTKARWANVVSKLGRKYDVGRAKHLFAEDVLDEAALQDEGLARYISTRREALLLDIANAPLPE